VSDVRTWLIGIGLGQYAETFEANDLEMGLLKSSAALVQPALIRRPGEPVASLHAARAGRSQHPQEPWVG